MHHRPSHSPDLAEACAKVSLIRDSGGKKQSLNHTVEEDNNERGSANGRRSESV